MTKMPRIFERNVEESEQEMVLARKSYLMVRLSIL